MLLLEASGMKGCKPHHAKEFSLFSWLGQDIRPKLSALADNNNYYIEVQYNTTNLDLTPPITPHMLWTKKSLIKCLNHIGTLISDGNLQNHTLVKLSLKDRKTKEELEELALLIVLKDNTRVGKKLDDNGEYKKRFDVDIMVIEGDNILIYYHWIEMFKMLSGFKLPLKDLNEVKLGKDFIYWMEGRTAEHYKALNSFDVYISTCIPDGFLKPILQKRNFPYMKIVDDKAYLLVKHPLIVNSFIGIEAVETSKRLNDLFNAKKVTKEPEVTNVIEVEPIGETE